MDFPRVMKEVTGCLKENDLAYAVIGGLGLVGYGYYRTTIDLDLVVDGEGQDRIIGFVEALGYETLHRSAGYSNHVHPDPDWGGIDFVYVRGETSKKIFASVRYVDGPAGQMPVPSPEHLIAMKVLAMKNDPKRSAREMADIEFLVTLDGVDREEVRGYFERHGLLRRFDELEESS